MRQINKILFFLSVLTFSGTICSYGQTDITIDDRSYKIIERYENGSIKEIGQFGTDCTGDNLRKHGYFIWYDETGKETKKRLYFYGQRRNRKFLGLKQGWWGWYGRTEKYFLGIRVTKPVIVDPCF